MLSKATSLLTFTTLPQVLSIRVAWICFFFCSPGTQRSWPLHPRDYPPRASPRAPDLRQTCSTNQRISGRGWEMGAARVHLHIRPLLHLFQPPIKKLSINQSIRRTHSGRICNNFKPKQPQKYPHKTTTANHTHDKEREKKNT